MSQRATKQETELRVAHAAELVAEGQAYSSITTHVAAKYGISRRRARQITSNAYLLLKNDKMTKFIISINQNNKTTSPFVNKVRFVIVVILYQQISLQLLLHKNHLKFFRLFD